MKRKAAVRYLLHSYRNPLLIFYGIILLVSLLVCTLMEVQVRQGRESQFRQWS